jgi:hypothetical protein
MSHKWVGQALLGIVLVTLSSGSAWAQSREMVAKLTGGEEAPTAVNSGAFGTATVTVDAGSGEITYTIRVWNLPTGVVAAHFHVGAEKTAGPVIIDIPVPSLSSNDFTITGTTNVANFVARPDHGIRSANDALQAVLGENTYINVHSQANPGGEIRGQVKLDPR